ncbi:MAG: transporter substrate-binding domain-containing protein [Candidatus Babeliales bacterium]|nr:transporter substrate-binding domain-containing protein [Candidatus Babeliales bacterium]
MKLRLYIILGFLLIVTIGSYLTLQNLTEEDNSTLVIGTASGYAPWVSMNASGELEGFDIDVINAIGLKLNKKIILKDLGSMSSLLIALNQNKIYAIIWGMSITQDRLNNIAMVHYQGETDKSYPLIFWQKIPDNIKSINDMKGLTVSVEPASTQDIVLSKYKNIIKIATEKVDDALLNIQYGKTNAAFVELPIAKKFKNKFPEIQILDIPLAQEDQVQGVGICIKLNNTKLINKIETAAQELKQDGTIKKLETKWNMS